MDPVPWWDAELNGLIEVRDELREDIHSIPDEHIIAEKENDGWRSTKFLERQSKPREVNHGDIFARPNAIIQLMQEAQLPS